MLKISDYIDAIETEVKAWGIQTVLFNPVFKDEDELENLVTPAVFILCDSSGAITVSDSGDGSLSEPFNMELVCCISSNTADADKAVFNLASFVKQKVSYNHWGLGEGCCAPENITGMNTTGLQKGIKEWRVSFVQKVKVASPEKETPKQFNELYLGINPKTDEDYKLIGEIVHE